MIFQGPCIASHLPYEEAQTETQSDPLSTNQTQTDSLSTNQSSASGVSREAVMDAQSAVPMQ